ncbi:pectate lyase family protein [Goodfellowiella coeruleoviolacea]|uniref:Pectate lyase n=1 Tax=Goodfellowiella coeruleoviolacea TaxID=334858 RepID=A0AAE3GDN3_9PSEU|nr:pectate lyase [Goodfellowiella coeruleoviolacea]MCP2165359.1 pectate lyase [Goodfellowiella coeruleoviolacea]
MTTFSFLSSRSRAAAATAALGLVLAGATAATAASPADSPFADAKPVGYAAVNASGQNGTTGGAGGTTVTVSNASDLLKYAQSSSAYVINVSGTITLSGMNKVASNKTIVGVGSNATITGGGLNLSTVQNVIIRNLTFTNAADDSINLQESTHHVWIDHNNFTNGHDGLVDIKRGSDYVTVSWNRFYNHDKTMLLGHSDDNSSQDLGHLRVSYHHNWFQGTTQRHPRVRFADPVHVYNNYYDGVGSYGVASTMNAGVLVEGNYFKNVKNPTVIQTGDSDEGRLVERNNVYSGSGSPQTKGSVGNPGSYYSYTLDSAANIPSIVSAGAGVGKL